MPPPRSLVASLVAAALLAAASAPPRAGAQASPSGAARGSAGLPATQRDATAPGAAQSTSAKVAGGVPGQSGDAASLIAEYGLRAAPEPVSSWPRWRRPVRIVVDDAVPGLTAAVREAAPGITVVAAATPQDFRAAVASADVAIGRTPVVCAEQVVNAGPELRWIQVVSAGVELCVGKAPIAARRQLLTNMRAISAPVIAEHAIGTLLALTRGLTVSIPRQASGQWSTDYGSQRLVALQGKTMLVVGLGGIGGEIAKRAHALGMRVIATRGSSRDKPDYVDYVGLSDELPTLLGQADVVADALPLTTATRGLFDAAMFARMRPTAYFLNVGRGGTVVTDALVAALQSGRLAGAALDVTEPEPLPKDHPLWRAPNVVITPHNSNDSDLGVDAQRRVVVENVRRYVAGEPLLSVVDPTRGY
jgi:phosphoglycerate dehydrogenase-like enzyme